MSVDRSSMITMGVSALALAVGCGVFALPNYRDAAAVESRVRELRERVRSMEEEQGALQALATELDELRVRIDTLKRIPGDPDVARLMQHLSLPVDGGRVLDQTFSTGRSSVVDPGESEALAALPVNVSMTSDFESAFATLRAVETLDRLVRTTAVRVSRDADREDGVVTAEIGLEALFRQPAAPKENGT